MNKLFWILVGIILGSVRVVWINIKYGSYKPLTNMGILIMLLALMGIYFQITENNVKK